MMEICRRKGPGRSLPGNACGKIASLQKSAEKSWLVEKNLKNM
jgi:hypothetical protein